MPTLAKQHLKKGDALKQAANVLGLDDTKRLETAIAVASADELGQNARFAASVRAIYGLLPPSTKHAGSPLKTLDVLTLDVKPIKHVEGFSFDPSHPVNPYLLHEAYGTVQMRKLLEVATLPALKQSSAIVEQRNPGTKPKSRASKASIVDYIMEHIAK